MLKIKISLYSNFSQMEMKKDTEKVRKRKSTGGHETSKMAKIEVTNQTL